VIIIPDMAVPVDRAKLNALADKTVADILNAAASWAREVPSALTLPIRAVCVRLAEMAADQRHYLAPLPEPHESERRLMLELVAEKLRSARVTHGIEKHLQELAERELRVTGSWSLVPDSQTAWVTTAVQYLESAGAALPQGQHPDPYWADDVAGGIVVSVKAILGTDDLHVRIESQYAGGKRPLPAEE
jgi:hypothetical protein